jgi:hypothetical protein
MLFWSFPPVDSPSRITGHRQLCRNAWQNLKNVSLCLQALCLIVDCVAIENPGAFVQKLWMMGTSCGNERKKRQKLEREQILRWSDSGCRAAHARAAASASLR